MSILTIVKDGDPVLRQKAGSLDVHDPNVQTLARDMIDTLLEAGGMGLAAPQVGQSVRLIVMRTGPEDWHPRAFVNPRIERTEGEQLSIEGCLSVPGRGGRVMRPYKLWMRYDDIAVGEDRVEKFKGIMAVCVAHECDHLDGVLFTDKLYNPFARRQA